MVQIIFDKPEHLSFMGANIFGHDFLHDFNVAKLLIKIR
jgi:hypothetical protein